MSSIPPLPVAIVFAVFALVLTFGVPVGRLRGHHLALNVMIFFSFALTGLAVAVLGRQEGLWAGPLAGLLAIGYRDVLRWINHFRWETYRFTHPYYYYNLIARRLVRGFMGAPQRGRRRY